MLIGYGLKGYKSFRDFTKIDMYANKKLTEHKDSPLKINDNESLLKMLMLYGANGSGKTNLINGISSLKNAFQNFSNFKNEMRSIEDTLELEIELLINNKKCVYNLQYSAVNNSVVSEEFGIEEQNYEPIYVIENGECKILSEEYFEDAQLERIKIYIEDLNKKDLLINKLADVPIFKDTLPCKYHYYITQKMYNLSYKDGIQPRYYFPLSSDDSTAKFLTLLKKFDSDIENIEEEIMNLEDIKSEIPNKIYETIISQLEKWESDFDVKEGKSRITFTDKYSQFIFLLENREFKVYKYMYKIKSVDKKIEYSDLSDGTRSIIRILDTIMFEKDCIFILDEIERSFHLILLEQLIKYFRKNAKDHNNQFIMSTHNTNILSVEYLRRDEVYFVEKENASSHIENLANYSLRKDTSIDKLYLNGRFGAIPNILDIGGESED